MAFLLSESTLSSRELLASQKERVSFSSHSYEYIKVSIIHSIHFALI